MDFLTRGHMLADVSAVIRLARHRVRGDRSLIATSAPNAMLAYILPQERLRISVQKGALKS
jgi:hypothetical protein